jgi:hypothetical protein
VRERKHCSSCKKELPVEIVQGEKLPIGREAVAGVYRIS